MTITSPTRQRRPWQPGSHWFQLFPWASSAGPVAFAGPAAAATTASDRTTVECWPRPRTLINNEKAGLPQVSAADVKFAFKIKCDKKTHGAFEHWILKERSTATGVKYRDDDGRVYNVNEQCHKSTQG